MQELIWVGNTLYPRWLVIAVPVALVVVPFMIYGLVSFVQIVWRVVGHR